MGISTSSIHNAGKRDPKVPRTVYRKNADGTSERRSERYPSGVVERFVNLQGSEVTCQLLPGGVAKNPDAIGKARMQLQRAVNGDKTVEGFVEFEKCPLRHGVHLRSARAEDEFAMMPDEIKRPCAHDPDTKQVIQKGHTKHLQYSDPCPHILWLMKSRQEREAERRNARSARQVSSADMERQKLEIAQQQLVEQRKANERMAAAVEGLSGRQPKNKAGE